MINMHESISRPHKNYTRNLRIKFINKTLLTILLGLIFGLLFSHHILGFIKTFKNVKTSKENTFCNNKALINIIKSNRSNVLKKVMINNCYELINK